jgi:hypothetical protein
LECWSIGVLRVGEDQFVRLEVGGSGVTLFGGEKGRAALVERGHQLFRPGLGAAVFRVNVYESAKKDCLPAS